MTGPSEPAQPGLQPAPDLELPDTHGTPVRLSALRGGPVLLVFFPFAFSRICHGELAELRDHLAEFTSRGVRLFGVSTDPMFALRAWSEQEAFGFELLSDFWPHGQAARRFEVFDERNGHARRGSFLIDADGHVRWATVNPHGQARELDEYREALAALSG